MTYFSFNDMLKTSIYDLDDISELGETYLPFGNANNIYPNFDNDTKLGNFFKEANDKHMSKAFEKIFCPNPINEENKEIISSLNGKEENRNNQTSTSINQEREKEEKKEEGKNIQESFSNNIFFLNQEIELEENNEEEIPNIVPKNIRKFENGNDKEGGRYNEIIFKTKTNQIPGRKPRDEKELSYIKKRHRKNAFDNVATKIQVNFISFLISFSNDIIKEELNNDKTLIFKDIDYKEKSNVKSEHLEIFKKLKVKDILQKPISRKFRSLNENYNKVIYNKIINLSLEVCEEYFNMGIVPIFQKYYNNCKPFNKIILNGKTIYLSKETKSFYDLIKKNDIIKNELIECAKLVYLKEKEQFENNNFEQMFFINKKY